MTEIQTALLESYHHWDDNVKSYPWRGNEVIKADWIDDNCGDKQCALCAIFNARNSTSRCCDGCPLGPETCCDEYEALTMAAIKGTSRLHHVEAVRDRLQAECEKEGLI